MNQSLVITFIAQDSPGLVGRVSGVVREHGGNWLRSRMSVLGGHFAAIAEIHVPADRTESLLSALSDLSSDGITVHTARSEAGGSSGSERRLNVLGNDRPGIISEVTAALAAQGINVLELNSDIRSAAMSGESLFEAAAIIQLSEKTDEDALKDALDAIADQLALELELAES